MNISGILSIAKTGTKSIIHWGAQHAPELCLGAGVGSIIYGTVQIAKTHRHFDELNNQRIDNVEDAKDIWEEEHEDVDNIPKAVVVRMHICEDIKLASHYLPGICFMAGGLVLIFESHNLMRARINAAVTYANGLLALFNQYRERVREDQGEAKDREYLTGTVDTSYSYDGETSTGKTRKMHGNVRTLNPDGESYTMRKLDLNCNRLFDETDLREVNHNSFNAIKTLANRELKIKQAVFMDELYKVFDLSLEDFPEAKVTGYILDPNWEDHHEGPQIDFIIYDERPSFPQSKSSVVWEGNRPEGNVWIEFLNVDGYILDKVEAMGFRGLTRGN